MAFILAGLLLVSPLPGAERLPTADTRAGLVAGFRLVMTAHDHDGDRRLSRAEWTAMVSMVLPEQPRETPPPENYAQVRDSMLAYYAQQDRNHDGFLDLRELLREPLAQFACADRNRNGRVSERETWRAMTHCPSRETRIGFIPEPQARGTAR